jgi:beta-glucosidase
MPSKSSGGRGRSNGTGHGIRGSLASKSSGAGGGGADGSPFPKEFIWGAGCSSYQLEGGAFDDGKGWSIWDAYCRLPGAIFAGQTGDIACDHYHRSGEDVKLMTEVGIRAYRLSISWPRVMPLGTGAVNQKGLAFYDKLVDQLLDAGIEPYITLFHWDYPLELFYKGAWLNRESPEWFADYTRVVVDKLSDRVRNWITINEPQVFLAMGLGQAPMDVKHAPGMKLPVRDFLRAVHHTLMAHGRCVQVIRERAKTPPIIGWAPTGTVGVPATGSKADIEAARTHTAGIHKRDGWNHAWYADPIILGHYPEAGLRLFGADMPKFPSSDFKIMKQPLDYYGLNLYSGDRVRAGARGAPEILGRDPGHPMTHIRWFTEPDGLEWAPRFLHEKYKLPIIITENGMSSHDWVGVDGRVRDGARIDFTTRYLRSLGKAIASGVPVKGYFHWSIMDNFEWAEGFRDRFGLIHVDYMTQKRTLKDSAHWYRGVIESNGASLYDTAAAGARA